LWSGAFLNSCGEASTTQRVASEDSTAQPEQVNNAFKPIALIMKRNLTLAFIATLCVTIFSGCAALLVGAAAGAGGAAYVQGELRMTEPVALEAAQRAAEQAMKDLKLAVIKRQQDGLSGAIEGRTAGDQKVTIKTKRLTAKSTEIRVRVGLLGDETMSRQILSRMQANY
jgi:Protein of unknown function (DUF3568)